MPCLPSVQHNAAVPLGLTATRTGYPLLDHAAAQIGIDLALLGAIHRLPKRLG